MPISALSSSTVTTRMAALPQIEGQSALMPRTAMMASGMPMPAKYHTLELLIEEVKNKSVKHISLEATYMGRPLYERYGFVSMNDEMELPEDCM